MTAPDNLDASLQRLCRRFSGYDRLLEYEDMLQECRIAAFVAGGKWREGAGRTREAWAYHCALQWLLGLRQKALRRRSLAPTVHYEAWTPRTRERRLQRRDFVPFLVETMVMKPPPAVRPKNDLTREELPVLRLLCKGKVAAEIAEILFLARKTVEGHKYQIYKRWGVRNAIEAYNEAMRRGIIKPPRVYVQDREADRQTPSR